uniref:Uncharacterized protein n=1 Tax=Vespula pensylvanica TaxID=30213 RepID=A0A834P5E3_VESPE|nr:hypothetical protein H0235_005649 [Vespula pensylvanica]
MGINENGSRKCESYVRYEADLKLSSPKRGNGYAGYLRDYYALVFRFEEVEFELDEVDRSGGSGVGGGGSETMKFREQRWKLPPKEGVVTPGGSFVDDGRRS